MKNIDIVAILGANGTMGVGCAGIISAFGNAKTFMVSRTIEKAEEAIEKSIKSVRSESIRIKLIPATFGQLEFIIPECDWIIEATAENYEVKSKMNKLISKYRKPGTIVSTNTSGLSIETLSKDFDDDGRKNFLGTHFFNPPYKMLLCELVTYKENSTVLVNDMNSYLEKVLKRKVVVVKDSPAFEGNRIGFQFINEVAQYAEKYASRGGIPYMDEILGGFTGRAMPPLLTLDFVGLDIHKAIIDNLYAHCDDESKKLFILPQYIKNLVSDNKLGKKSGSGLYKTEVNNGEKSYYFFNIVTGEYELKKDLNIDFVVHVKKEINVSNYRKAMDIILSWESEEADICRYFLSRYISYSFSTVGTIVSDYDSMDKAMGYGFNWIPPSALVDFIGGVDKAIELLVKYKLPVAEVLLKERGCSRMYKMNKELDARAFFKAK